MTRKFGCNGRDGDDRLLRNHDDDRRDGSDGHGVHGDGWRGGRQTGSDFLFDQYRFHQQDGSDGNDWLIGGRGRDRLDGHAGDDLLLGRCGDDHLDGANGNDLLFGGRGDDVLHGGAGRDFLYGFDGNDALSGGAGDDRLTGGRDHDQLDGGAGDDTLFGDAGDDLFTYQTGDGNDFIDGGAGAADMLRLQVEDGWVLDLSHGKVVSEEGGKLHLSSHAIGEITLADGSTIRFRGIEQIDASAAGGDSNQPPIDLSILAGPVAENAPGGAIVGAVSAVDPDAGDTLVYALTDDADGRFAIDPSSGVITVAQGALLDHESAPQHNISVNVTDAGGLSVSQSFTITVANVNEAPRAVDLSANAVMEGAPDGTVVGTVSALDPDIGDSLTFALTDDAGGRFAIDPDTGVITVADGPLLDHESASQHLIEVEVTDADGLSHAVSHLIEVKLDNSGDDIMTGGASDDVIDGGPGDDTLGGEAGDDHLLGGAGNDQMMGGEGDDRLDGDDGDDFLFGDGGDDHLDGGAGHDSLFGGLGDNLLEGGEGDDDLFGNAGDDRLLGGAGNDTLFGSLGSDVLSGGAGDDELTGGAGNDRFVFSSADDGLDLVRDFGAGDVMAIGDMLTGYSMGDEASFVRLAGDGVSTTLQVDVDGAANGAVYQSIAVLSGVTGVTLADLVDAAQLDFWVS